MLPIFNTILLFFMSEYTPPINHNIVKVSKPHKSFEKRDKFTAKKEFNSVNKKSSVLMPSQNKTEMANMTRFLEPFGRVEVRANPKVATVIEAAINATRAVSQVLGWDLDERIMETIQLTAGHVNSDAVDLCDAAFIAKFGKFGKFGRKPWGYSITMTFDEITEERVDPNGPYRSIIFKCYADLRKLRNDFGISKLINPAATAEFPNVSLKANSNKQEPKNTNNFNNIPLINNSNRVKLNSLKEKKVN